VIVDDARQAIVGKTEFDEVQRLLERNCCQSRRLKENFSLSGKLKCPCCGGNLIGKSHHNKDGKVCRYYYAAHLPEAVGSLAEDTECGQKNLKVQLQAPPIIVPAKGGRFLLRQQISGRLNLWMQQR
jgi:hypothetical protein